MHRDRHDRGLRGPLAAPNLLTRRAAQPRQPPGRTAFFDAVVSAAVERIREHCPDALSGVDIGMVDVPEITDAWDDTEPPLSAAVDATETQAAKIVLYRRPLEHRAGSASDLRDLAQRTLVEQLSVLTGLEVSAIDPQVDDD